MPRETVGNPTDEYVVKVGWSPNGSVQVGMEVKEGENFPADFTTVWSSQDREQCNSLIKVLRRARDAAYGREDE